MAYGKIDFAFILIVTVVVPILPLEISAVNPCVEYLSAASVIKLMFLACTRNERRFVY